MIISKQFVIAWAFVCGLVLLAQRGEAQGTPKCRQSDGYSAMLIATLKDYVTSQDPTVIYNRDSSYHVPVVPPNQIALVTDERVCSKVVLAYSTLPHGAYAPTRVYVIKMGSKFTVGLDPDIKAGEFNIVRIFDSKYSEIGGWVGG